jgi:peptidoglycan/LPS O-acetylase OafA/YrhL
MTHQAHLSHPKYRPDIDGLRAIAVLSVVAFHAFPAQIEGGFIGVDVFFVISGFLISTIIFESLEKGSFSFIEFYSRRIRRIFPALLLVLIACLIFGWFSLLPEELNQLGRHVTAGAVFVSNLILWSETGYFDNSAETKPLLHLWSLGIEEQFYIFWPFLLWAAWKNKINFFLITFLLLIASFSLSIWLIHTNPVETFYSPLTRFWELLCGALLALYTIRKANTSSSNQFFFSLKKLTTDHSQKYSNFLSPSMISFIGFGLLTAGFYLIDKNMKFPGYWALFPVLGSILIILSGPKAWLNRKVLSNKFLVWLGLISFPLYLWHWPLLSFGRIIYFDEPPLKYRYLAIFLSVFLAWLTMKFVERPLRFSTPKSSLRVFSLSSLLLTLAFMGVIISSSNFQDTHSFDKLIVKRKGEHAIG